MYATELNMQFCRTFIPPLAVYLRKLPLDICSTQLERLPNPPISLIVLACLYPFASLPFV